MCSVCTCVCVCTCRSVLMRCSSCRRFLVFCNSSTASACDAWMFTSSRGESSTFPSAWRKSSAALLSCCIRNACNSWQRMRQVWKAYHLCLQAVVTVVNKNTFLKCANLDLQKSITKILYTHVKLLKERRERWKNLISGWCFKQMYIIVQFLISDLGDRVQSVLQIGNLLFVLENLPFQMLLLFSWHPRKL